MSSDKTENVKTRLKDIGEWVCVEDITRWEYGSVSRI